jgi:rod shape-determining protein MreD
MGNFLSIPILAIAVALQASFVPQVRILGGGPELVLLLVTAWAINAELRDSLIWAFVGGIMQDLLSLAPLGTSTLGLLLIVFGISGLGQQVHKIGFVLLVAITLVGTLVHQLVVMGVMTFTGLAVDWVAGFTYVIAPTMLYNLALIGPVYWAIRRLQRRVGVSRDKSHLAVR